MEDRELLEAAAKAAGYGASVEREHEADPNALWRFDERMWWNPLVDDGDALRLAVKLHINIEHLRTLKGMYFNEVAAAPFGRGDCLATIATDDEPFAATRRAIVRAAAALSKGA